MDDLGHKDWRMWALGLAPYGAMGAGYLLQDSALMGGPYALLIAVVALPVAVAGFGAFIATLGLALLIPFMLLVETVKKALGVRE